MIRSENKYVRFIINFSIFFITRFLISKLMDLLRNNDQAISGAELLEYLVFSMIMAAIFQFIPNPKEKE